VFGVVHNGGVETISEVAVDVQDAEISFGARLTQLAERHPDAVSIIFVGTDGSERTITWAQLEQGANAVAWMLSERGVGVGDLVAVGLPRCPEHFAATFGAWKVGATVLSLSADLPQWERSSILADVQAAAVIADGDTAPGAINREMIAALTLTPAATFPSEVANPPVAMCSGGSTGRPKVVLAPGSGARIPGQTLGPVGEVVGLRSGRRTLVTSPLYHNLGFYLTYLGIFDDNLTVMLERFDAAKVVDLVERYRIDWMTLVPTMMQRICQVPDVANRDLSSLDVVLHTAAPCPAWLKEAWINLIGPEHLLEVYGSTEQVGFCVISGTEWLEHRGSIGRPFFSELRVLDATGSAVAVGEVGELYMRMMGSTGPSFQYAGGGHGDVAEGGFASIGDLGWIDEDGYVYLADRRLDLIISGGANIYPAEVEAALGEHPAVADAVVVGLTDPDRGQRVHAIVQPRVGAARPSDEELAAFTRERLAAYKVPRSWEWLENFPRNEAGKVRRSALVAERDSRS